MKIIKDLREILAEQENAKIGLSIGNFDGVHRGHQDLLRSIKKECADKGLLFVIVTFIPHPHQILSPSENFLVSTYNQRRELLSSVGADYLLEINFTRDLSTLAPKKFLDQYIFHTSAISKLFIGYDFAFGADKVGDNTFIEEYCLKEDIDFEIGKEFRVDGIPVSSTIIREHIKDGNIKLASQLLGRDFSISGRVAKGDGRGRKIGYPTANLKHDREMVIPCGGVYISTTNSCGRTFHSITNIGVNPTFCDDMELTIETHIFNFDYDIYGETMLITLFKKIRDEMLFNSSDELIEQIAKDVRVAYRFHNL